MQVIPAVCKVLSLGGDLIVLIKPQFEAKRAQISRGGLVRDPAVHEEVIDKVRAYVGQACWHAAVTSFCREPKSLGRTAMKKLRIVTLGRSLTRPFRDARRFPSTGL